MATRRDFLKGTAAATGITFCSCGSGRGPCAAARRATPAGDGQWQAGQDHRCALALPLPRGSQPDGRRGSRGDAADQGCRRSTLLSSKSGSKVWTPWPSTWRCSPSIRSGTARTATQPPRSSRCRTRSWPSCALRGPTASPPSPRSRCSIRTWRCSSSRRA